MKFNRKRLTIKELFNLFPNDKTAEEWFVKQRWPHDVACPRCGSLDVQTKTKHKTMPYRCRDCRKWFSSKTDTALEGSHLGFQAWMIAAYLVTTNLKGISSRKLKNDLGITQKSAWFLAHRIREAWGDGPVTFFGPVEVDETYIGGREKNKHYDKRIHAGRGAVGKTPVVGIKDRATNQVKAVVSPETTQEELQGFIKKRTHKGATVYTDDHKGYQGLGSGFQHRSVRHSIRQYVDGHQEAHTNGIESFWAMLKRGYCGIIYHQMSPKHLQRYVNEFTGRHNIRSLDTPRPDEVHGQGNGWEATALSQSPGKHVKKKRKRKKKG